MVAGPHRNPQSDRQPSTLQSVAGTRRKADAEGMSAQVEPAVAASGVRKRRGPLTWVSRDGLSGLVFLLPLLLIFGTFSWFPILRSFVMAVQYTNLVSPATFVGLDNFATVLADPLFGTSVANTAYFALLRSEENTSE